MKLSEAYRIKKTDDVDEAPNIPSRGFVDTSSTPYLSNVQSQDQIGVGNRKPGDLAASTTAIIGQFQELVGFVNDTMTAAVGTELVKPLITFKRDLDAFMRKESFKSLGRAAQRATAQRIDPTNIRTSNIGADRPAAAGEKTGVFGKKS